jgi:hypothetical protein
MANLIQEIFCEPAIVIARLGGSTTPLVAYRWVASIDPRDEGDTVIEPDWSFDILPDGSISPFKPDSIRFRDGSLIRPTCPFIEVWARIGEPGSDRASWSEVPLTEAMLRQAGGDRAALSFAIDARNTKAARRADDPNLVYGLFPSMQIAGDDHRPTALNAVSPPGAARPMIPPGRQIPLGFAQVVRPQPNAPMPPWPSSIDLDVIRLRFTPGRGEFYGPPQAARPTPESGIPAVRSDNAFLDAGAGWFNSLAEGPKKMGQSGYIEPQDTFDFFQVGRNSHSLGVVDDTCEARIDVTLRLGAATLTTHADVLVGPPDFAPDRRPFLSLADELNDRAADAGSRSAALAARDLDDWVQDLFQRAYETVSLMNVDHWRREHGRDPLPADQLAPTAITGDGVPRPDKAMGGRDKLRDRSVQVPQASGSLPLPLSQRARERHRAISDIENLKSLIVASPDRVRDLVRGPFEHEPGESNPNAQEWTSMRMPPFMRGSNANPLTLSAWQYDLLMRWASELVAARPAIVARAAGEPAPMSAAAAARRAEVLARIG